MFFPNASPCPREDLPVPTVFDHTPAVCPDVFVVFGAQKRQRETYKVWEENGKIPDWVLEVTSSITQQEDEQDKPEIYAQIGVREYFQYDPMGDYLNPLLKGRLLVGDRYQVLTPDRLEDGTLVLGCGQKQLVRGDPREGQGEAFGEDICQVMS